jgi:hypothetical protein
LIAIAAALSVAPGRPAAAEGARVPVVVELFTSEGCSSCPPADALLAELDRTQPVAEALIIPLEEHVDYWNSLGWRDPFSSADFTARQEAYARRLRLAGPYTPQMVVGGQRDVLGSAAHQVRAAIAAAAHEPHAEVSVVATAGIPPEARLRVTIRMGSLPPEVPERLQVCMAITEDGLASRVSAGENSGRHLEHRAVVRTIAYSSAGSSLTMETRLAPEWKRENLRVVAFLAGASSGHIFGAATARVVP